MDEEEKQNPELRSISEAAIATGISESTIRYYDSEFGEFLDIKRDSANRRSFNEKDIRQMQYIRKLLKKDGLTIKQVKDRLAIERELSTVGPKVPDNAVIDLISERISRIERQQDLLVKAVETTLKEVRHTQRLLDLNLTRLSLILGSKDKK